MRTDSAPRSDTSPRPDDAPVTSQVGADARLRGEAESTAPPRGGAGTAVMPEATPIAGGAARIPAISPRAARRPLSPRARLYLALGVVVVVALFLTAARSVLQPFIWAAVLAYILNPVVGMVQTRLRLRHGISVGLVVLVLVGLAAWGVTTAVGTLRNDVVAFANSLALINNYITTSYLPNAGTPTILGIPIQVTQIVRNAQAAIIDSPRLLLHGGLSAVTGTLDGLLQFLTFILSTIYLLLDGARLRGWVRARIPAAQRDDVNELGHNISKVLSEYLRAEVILILIMSTASLIVLSILGVRFAIVLAPIVGFLEIFPIIGPFFAIAMVTLVALIGPPGFGLQRPGFALIVALIFFIMRQIEDYVVIPNVVGHAVKLHPVLILFALLSGATLGGILGMFLAVPVTGALKVLGSYIYDRLVD